MIIIKTASIEVKNQDHKLISAQPSFEGFYLKFSDGTEVTIPCQMTPALQNAVQVLMTSTAGVITLDLRNPSQPLSFSN